MQSQFHEQKIVFLDYMVCAQDDKTFRLLSHGWTLKNYSGYWMNEIVKVNLDLHCSKEVVKFQFILNK